MSEGGYFPWKVQKVQTVPTFDYSKLAVPLEPPPIGLQWCRDESTREWHLVSTSDPVNRKESDTVIPTSVQSPIMDSPTEPAVAVAVEVETAVPLDIPLVDHVTCENVIYHKVQPTDTLQGLCIKVRD